MVLSILTDFEDGLSVSGVETANSNAYVLKNASFEENALMHLLLLRFVSFKKLENRLGWGEKCSVRKISFYFAFTNHKRKHKNIMCQKPLHIDYFFNTPERLLCK